MGNGLLIKGNGPQPQESQVRLRSTIVSMPIIHECVHSIYFSGSKSTRNGLYYIILPLPATCYIQKSSYPLARTIPSIEGAFLGWLTGHSIIMKRYISRSVCPHIFFLGSVGCRANGGLVHYRSTVADHSRRNRRSSTSKRIGGFF